MSAIAAITIADGKAVPENHTFNPVESGSSSRYRTAVSTLPTVGQELISSRYREVNPTLHSVSMVLDLPALETASGANEAGYTAAPKVAYNHKVKVEFFLPTRGTAAQRKDLRVLLSNLLLNAQVVDLIDNLAAQY